MSRSTRLLAAVVATLMAFFSLSLPARAADLAAAQKAARWVATQTATITTAGGAADALIALAAGRDATTADEARALLEVIRTTGKDYALKDPVGAAKLVVALDAVGEDPRTFIAGVDLPKLVAAGVQADGSIGWPGPFSSGLAAAALERSGLPIPASMVTYVLTCQNADGGFGYAAGVESDADSTALAMIVLMASDSPVAKEALAKAVAWAKATQATDGSWTGYNKVNTVGMLGGSLETYGQADAVVAKATAYLLTQQQPSGAFLNGTKEDMLATTQGILLLGGVSYLDVAWTIPAAPKPTATPSATPTAKPTPTPTTTPTASAKPSVTSKPTASATPTTSATSTPTTTTTAVAPTTSTRTPAPATSGDRLPQTGTGTEPWFVAAAAVLALLGAGLLLARRLVR